jgi:hypothetical protein
MGNVKFEFHAKRFNPKFQIQEVRFRVFFTFELFIKNEKMMISIGLLLGRGSFKLITHMT